MAFYSNRVAIAFLNKDKLYLFRNINKEILIDYYSEEVMNKKDTAIKDALGEFDILINEEDEIYLLYQDIDYYLNIITISDGKTNKVTLTESPLPRLYELNLLKTQNNISIIYLTLRSQNERIFKIHHHLLESDQWINYDVEDIKVNRVLNPIKVISEDNRIILGYYYGNQICIKEFNLETKEWSESNILTNNNEKIYIDIIKKDNFVHLVYSEFINENLAIKYGRYAYDSYSLTLDKEEILSNESNPTNPTLIIHNNILWVVWNESLGIYSRYSKDNGLTWSPIYLWKESKINDFVRYKYVDNGQNEEIKLNYSFGTLHPDIKFIGFGALENVEEMDLKKKKIFKFPRL